ncbi:MAG: GMC family oxidoreductase [Paracoccaceae bacterium]|nr:MAG: GMC family oxidoreductase [Paracoccaceae bacterium]
MVDAPDVVVVGAGAGGGAVAHALTAAGARVLLLEAGPRFDPVRDYPQTAPDWERRSFPAPPGSRGAVTFGDLGACDAADADLASWTAAQPRRAPPARREVTGEGYWHVQGWGGTTLHFIGEAHRMHPQAMRLRSVTGAGVDWPIGYDDLEPFYLQAETVLGVAGPAEAGDRWRSAPYPLPAHPLSPGARRLAEAGARLGLPWEANARAALSQPWDDRPGCIYCGQCGRGCPIGDKGSADVTFLRRAEVTGRLEARVNAPVLRLHPGAGGRIVALDHLDGDRVVRVETPVLVLAAGAVQTPRLLLLSAGPEAPGGVANGSGHVGRHFIETLSWLGTGLVPGLSGTHLGLPSDAICWGLNAPGSVPGLPGGCRFHAATQERGLNGPVAYGTRVVPGFGAGFKAALRAGFGTALSVGAMGEKLPDEVSRVDLDPEARDGMGLALPRITSVLGRQDIALLRFMAGEARRLLAEAGAVAMAEEGGSWDGFSATHVFGTCRMAARREDGVVGPDGRAFDHGNLWIADASVFPTGGGGESPSLTVQALALRTAAAILAG